jgi:cell division transport system permease protein
MFTSLKRVLKAGWKNFKRHMGLSVATIFIMTLTILTITSLFIFYNVSNSVISLLKEKVGVSVYFKDFLEEEEILTIKSKIEKLSEVEKVDYVSNQQAIEALVQRRPELADTIKETESFLNIASLNIKAYEPEQYSKIVEFLENSDFSDKIEVDYYQRKNVIDKMSSFVLFVKKGGIILSVILFIIALGVAFTQIKLAIMHSKGEIGIQRLVGASNWFIRGPFLTQALIEGLIAAILSFSLCFASFYFLSPKMKILFPELDIFNYFANNIWYILLIQFATGVIISLFSSSTAMRRYLEI